MSYTDYVLDDHPALADLQTLWNAISVDPTVPGNFTDSFPTTLIEFLAPIETGSMHLWLIRARDGEPLGAHWYHDRGLWGQPDSVWTAGYRLRSARGGLGAGPQVEANRRAATDLGVEHFFAACRASNMRSRGFVEKCGYHDAGIYPQWAVFDGALDDVVLYTVNPEDQALLLDQAAQRAAYHRRNALVLA